MQQETSQNENDITINLDSRLKEAVKRAGGAKRVASATGFGESTIYNYLRLKPVPPLDFVSSLARAAQVRPDWLILGRLPISETDESGDWETNLPHIYATEKRVPIRDVAASAGHGLEVFDEDPRQWFTFPLEWLATMGNPDAMDIVRVDGESMEPELRDGDHVMIDRSQVQTRDGLYVITVDDHLFVKRLQMMGRNRAMLASTNSAYRGFEISLADELVESDDEISQDVARIVGRVVWSGRMIR